MIEANIDKLISSFGLNDNQRLAALERERDVVVTAGAGSGKTLTLVARYTTLLAEGIPPRRLAAITFTKKAAREMRSRVRTKLMALQQISEDEHQRQKWSELSAQMDSARIGTIHSLCAEILRAHPAEAGIDPRFEVLDEGLTAALRQQAVEDSLKVLADNKTYQPLLYNFPVNDLSSMLGELLNDRLAAIETFEKEVNPSSLLRSVLLTRINHPLIQDIIHDLQAMPQKELTDDAGDKLAEMVSELLAAWVSAMAAINQGEALKAAAILYQIRRSLMDARPGSKNSVVKGMVAELRSHFEALISPLTGGAKSTDPEPTFASEELLSALLPILKDAFEVVHRAFQDLVESRHALDFDHLESLAVQLLQRKEICTHWQNELDAVLVDEFQDTNHRQRRIIEALTSKPGQLFIVGDMRQSIYRFRQADVTVFSEVQKRINEEGGRLIDLDLTYRTHQPLLDGMGELLANAIGTQPDPRKPYYIPYTPMKAWRETPDKAVEPPHIEFIFGVGEDAQSTYPLAAKALAVRLQQLMEQRQIKEWDDVALLFRASTGFPDYEEALQVAGIPFVTVAGRGFYDRPEIRDLLNILRALADPQDDLAFAGLLRSPAFGLSDNALVSLRQNGRSYRSALQEDMSYLTDSDQFYAIRARQTLSALLPRVDRIPVAELIKQVIDALDYRAILATADQGQDNQDAAATGGRLYRNLDKLLDDALASQQVSLRSYLDMIKTLNDAGAREGEAPAEAQGAVRLMTIHKAKGLEFNIVVVAAAGRDTRRPSELVYLSPELGVVPKLDPPSMLYNLAKHMDQDQSAMEELRVLYVALTRAREKLIISGHAKPKTKGGLSFRAWAGKLVEAAGISPGELESAGIEPFTSRTPSGHPLHIWMVNEDIDVDNINQKPLTKEPEKKTASRPLYPPVEMVDRTTEVGELEENVDTTNWRASGQPEDQIPGKIIGRMVHKAVQRWLFPKHPELENHLAIAAVENGLVSEESRSSAVTRSMELLTRLVQHPIFQMIQHAEQRYHELPFTYQWRGITKTGYIDLLYKDPSGWHIIDFKTDPIETMIDKEILLNKYRKQVQEYHHALDRLLGIDADLTICFLDEYHEVRLKKVEE